MDCNGCRSTARSTAGGLISTQTVFTLFARKAPKASEKRSVANKITCVTSPSLSLRIFSHSMTSVVTPGIGPSSNSPYQLYVYAGFHSLAHFFFFNDTVATCIYNLSLLAALL